MKQNIFLFLVGLLIGVLGMWAYIQSDTPERKTFPEDSGESAESSGMIILEQPRFGHTITSPIVITGKARGNWYFEATFPVVLTDWDGRIIAEYYAEAQGNWMTTEFVPFQATLSFESPVFPNAPADHFSRRGSLILQKNNPSGLPEHDDALEITVFFAE